MSDSTRRAVLRGGLATGLAGGAAAVLAACQSESSSASHPARSSAPSSAAAPASAKPSSVPASTSALADFDPQDWESVRAQFALDPTLGQFAAFVLSPHTKVLDAAIAGYRDALATDTDQALVDGFRLEDKARQAAASYAGGSAGQYALTDSTTMGVATMYGGLSLSPGDRILTTTHDFYSTTESVRLLHERSGAAVDHVTLYDDPSAATVADMVDRLLAGLRPTTRVVAITWVHSSTGVRVPVREITDALAAQSVVPRERLVVCVDGVHGFNAVDVDLPDLGADFLASGTHKWLFGPRGTGILWGRDWAPLTALIPSFTGTDRANRLTPGGYHDFEHRWAVRDAFALMTQIGRDRVVQRTVDQATRLKQGLAALDRVQLVTPIDPAVSAGIVCLRIKGVPNADAVGSLRRQKVVASQTPYRVSYLRFGPSIVTNPDQVDAAIDAVGTLA